jgi:hypothetical protein
MSESNDRELHEDGEDGEDAPGTFVRVPIRRPSNPFTRPEYAVVPEDTAPHWSMRVWHDRPPR